MAEMPNIELTVDTSRLERAAKKLAKAYRLFNWDAHLASWLKSSVECDGEFANGLRRLIQNEIQKAKRAPGKHGGSSKHK